MKKRLMMILVVLSMMVVMVAGCGSQKEEADTQVSSEPVYMNFDGYGYVMGMLSFTEDDGENGTIESESVAVSLEGIPGQKIGEVWESAGYSNMQPVCEGETFEGWMEYKMNMTTDEEGFTTYDYERISGDTLYTTEELMEMTVPDYDVMYVVKWESISMEEYDAEYAMLSGAEEIVDTQEIYLVLDANGGMMSFDADEPYETDIYIYYLQEGKTISDIMNGEVEDPVTDIAKEGASFAGWTIYEGDFSDWPEEEPEDLAEGSQFFKAGEYMNILLDNCSVYGESVSMEELGEILCEGKTYFATANWE